MKRITLFLILGFMLSMGLVLNAQADSRTFVVVGKSANGLPKNFDRMVADLDGEVTHAMPQIGAAVVRSSSVDFPASLQKERSIKAVLPDRMFDLPEVGMQAYDNPPNSGDDDFLFDLQWGHDAVNAPEAWNAGVMGEGVLVAVLDSGVDSAHPDIASNYRGDLEKSMLGTPLPGDWYYHGTHVAGTIAAADNAFGTIGVAPKAEIFSVQVCGTGGCPASAIVPGIVYAASEGADLINMSLGGLDLISGAKVVKNCKEAGLPMKFCSSLQSSYIQNEILVFKRAFSYANRMNTTVVVSAGNDAVDADHDLLPIGGGEMLHLPSLRLSFADYPGTIGVSATAPIDWCRNPDADFNYLTTYSSYGRSVIDFSAPGGEGWYFDGDTDSCTIAGVEDEAWVFDLVFSTIPVSWGWYAWLGGTSMAAPHVTGVAALIISENGGNMKPSQVLSELRNRADDEGESGKDPAHGFGAVRTGY